MPDDTSIVPSGWIPTSWGRYVIGRDNGQKSQPGTGGPDEDSGPPWFRLNPVDYVNSNAAAAIFTSGILAQVTIGFEGHEGSYNTASPLVVTFPTTQVTFTGTTYFVLNQSAPNGFANSVGQYAAYGPAGETTPTASWAYLATSAGATVLRMSFSPPASALGFFGVDLGDWTGNLLLRFRYLDASTEDFIVPYSIGTSGWAPWNGSVTFVGAVTDRPFDQVELRIIDDQNIDVFAFDGFTAAVASQLVEDAMPPGCNPLARRRPRPTECIDSLTDVDIIGGDWRAGDQSIINEVAFSVDWDPDLGEYTKHVIYRADDSIKRYGRRQALQIPSKGIHTQPGHGCATCSYEIMDERAYNVFARYADPPPTLELAVFYRKHPIQVGDLVCVTSDVIPNPITGRRGLTEEIFEVVNTRIDFATEGRLVLTLLDVEAITLPRQPIRFSPEDNAQLLLLMRGEAEDDPPRRVAIEEEDEMLGVGL